MVVRTLIFIMLICLCVSCQALAEQQRAQQIAQQAGAPQAVAGAAQPQAGAPAAGQAQAPGVLQAPAAAGAMAVPNTAVLVRMGKTRQFSMSDQELSI